MTPEGKVKVLDFGLAKALEETSEVELLSSPTISVAATRAGVILGTAAYMSPEQARGKPVDRRADIWAFGCVLYELLAGKRPFTGDTITDCTVAIMTKEPDWSLLPAATPPRVRELLQRCLQKDPQRRLKHLGDAQWEMDQPAIVAAEPTGPTRHKISAWPAVAGALAIAGVFAVAGVWFELRHAPAAPKWAGVLLGGPTVASIPRVSPDGRTVAFAALVQNQTQVGVLNTDTADWSVLTRERARGSISRISWSRDGSQIYFDRATQDPNGVYVVSALGGEERLVLDNAAMPEVLPDGSLLLVRPNERGSLQLHHLWPATGRLEALPSELPPGQFLGRLAVFPDGKEVAFLGWDERKDRDAQAKLLVLDLETKKLRRRDQLPALDVGWSFALAATSDGREILTSVPSGNMSQIAAIPRYGDAPIRVVMSLTGFTQDIDVARDGTLFVNQSRFPAELVRLSASGGSLEHMAGSAQAWNARSLPDGRALLIGAFGLGRRQLLTARRGEDPSCIDSDDRRRRRARGDVE